MKRLSILALTLICLTILEAKAQFTTNKKITTNQLKTGTSLTPKLPTIAERVDPKSLRDKKIEQLTGSAIPTLPTEEELERNRIKSWEITPARPVTTGMSIEIYGRYRQDAFTILPDFQGRGENIRFWPNSNQLNLSLQPGKDYKLTMSIGNHLLGVGGNSIFFDMGGNQTYQVEVKSGQREVVFFFTNQISGNQTIAWGPILNNIVGGPNPVSYDLFSVKIEELAPAK
ncbi:hypothetical protein [Algoriphagus namhaensis]